MPGSFTCEWGGGGGVEGRSASGMKALTRLGLGPLTDYVPYNYYQSKIIL